MNFLPQNTKAGNREVTTGKPRSRKDIVWERLVIGFFLFSTVAFGLALSFFASGKKTVFPGKGKEEELTWTDSLAHRIKEIIPLKKDKTPEDLSIKLAPLLKGQEEVWFIRVEDLSGNFVWKHNDEKEIEAASLIKLPVVAYLFSQAQEGKTDLSQKIAVDQADFQEGLGAVSNSRPGTKFSLENIGREALNQSDNTAQAILDRVLGLDNIEQYLNKIGMVNTSVTESKTTAKDMALFFRQLYEGKLLSPQYRDFFYDALTRTAFEDRITLGVPEGMKVIHKVGHSTTLVADAGIVMVPDHPILLVLASNGSDIDSAKAKLAEITKETYWFLMADN